MPFAAGIGVRPTRLRLVAPGLAERVVVPSHDTLRPDERSRLAAREPLSWLHAQQPAADHGGDHAAALAASRAAVARLLADDVFGPVRGPMFAWYRLGDGAHQQTGLVGTVDVAAYRAGRVLPHEQTRVERERELASHRRTVAATSSPVALGVAASPRLQSLARDAARDAPSLDLHTTDGVRHTVWTVEDADALADVRVATAGIERAWVVDGHHRLAAAAAVDPLASRPPAEDPAERVLAVLFGLDELRVLAFHRRVTLPATTSEVRALLERVGRLEPLTPSVVPARSDTFAVCLEGRWHALRLHPTGADDSGRVARSSAPAVDAAVLQDRVLGPALGVTEPRTDPRLSHVGGDLAALAASCHRPGTVGFALRPVPMDVLTSAALAGEVLPPKTTRFDPKVRSGLFLRELG